MIILNNHEVDLFTYFKFLNSNFFGTCDLNNEVSQVHVNISLMHALPVFVEQSDGCTSESIVYTDLKNATNI